MNFEQLPLELLIRISNYLPPEDLWFNFRTVNRKLYTLITKHSYWSKRAKHRHGLVLPDRLKMCVSIVEADNIIASPFMPIYRCIATEQACDRWSYGLAHSVSTTGTHYGTIDAIRLFTINRKYFCLTGARDRQIMLWDLSTSIYKEDMPYWASVPVERAHDGWIWSISCLKYNADSFFSAGFDSIVQKWQMAEASIRPIRKINVNSAALSCINENENILYVSTYRSGPLLYDTRVACTSPIASNNCHGQRPVFELATKNDCNQIFSIGDDNKLAAVDKRRFESLISTYQSKESISHIDYEDKQLCLSLKNGHFLFFDPENLNFENEFTIINDKGNQLKGNQNIRISRGATFCACSDSTLRVFSPGIQPQQMARVKLEENLTRIDVLDGHMIATTTTETLRYWPNIEQPIRCT